MTTPSDPFSQGPPPPSQDSPYGVPPTGGYGQTGYGVPYGQQPAEPSYGAPSGQPHGSPFGQPGGPQLASWGIRVGGYLIDVLLSLAVGIVAGIVSAVIGDDAGILGNLAGLALFLYFGYLTGTTGQTPGRKAVGIRVLREQDGQVLGPGLGIGRSFLHILDALPLGLGFLWPLWDAKKQTFADKIAKSVVVRT